MTELQKQANELATELVNDIIHLRSNKMSDGSRIELPTAVTIAKYIAKKIQENSNINVWIEVENQLNDM